MARVPPDGVSHAEITMVARRVLLDALDELASHRDSLTLVGAQAVHLRTDDKGLILPSYTTDADLSVDPDLLKDEPRLERTMLDAGFEAGANPGSWLLSVELGGRIESVAVDLMVADDFSGPGSRRSGVIPPHGRQATRRTAGLEAAAIDVDVMTVSSLDPEQDDRRIAVRVAGPAALILAKCHKLGERAKEADGLRLVAKDAGDVFRLIYGSDVSDVVDRTRKLLDNPRSATSTRRGLRHLDALFTAEARLGVRLAAEALAGEVDEEEIVTIVPAFTSQLLRATSDGA